MVIPILNIITKTTEDDVPLIREHPQVIGTQLDCVNKRENIHATQTPSESSN